MLVYYSTSSSAAWLFSPPPTAPKLIVICLRVSGANFFYPDSSGDDLIWDSFRQEAKLQLAGVSEALSNYQSTLSLPGSNT
ncbi:hypothetical protein K1719_043783 [Acacia pycnantha]|nr:hypothetical protein K1719_043783 [Acacia pycnantha]